MPTLGAKNAPKMGHPDYLTLDVGHSSSLNLGHPSGVEFAGGLDVRLNDSFDLRAVELGAIAGGNQSAGSAFWMRASSIICTGVLPSIERKRFARRANAHSCDETA
jgi:hypothetical protein